MKEFNLKTCPLCGGEAKFVYGIRNIHIKCIECELTTGSIEESLDYCAKEEAAKVWNRRVDFGKTCPECGYSDTETKSVYSDGTLVEISTRCLKCGAFIEV